MYIIFNNTDNFPKIKGIYFIYKEPVELIYIGSARKQSIKTRLKQYLSEVNSGGWSFRKKVRERYNLKKGRETTDFIKNNFSIKYIYARGIDEGGILLLERACIHYFNPILND